MEFSDKILEIKDFFPVFMGDTKSFMHHCGGLSLKAFVAFKKKILVLNFGLQPSLMVHQ